MRTWLFLWHMYGTWRVHLRQRLFLKNSEYVRTNLQRSLHYGYLRGSWKLQLFRRLWITWKFKAYLWAGLWKSLHQWKVHCAWEMHMQRRISIERRWINETRLWTLLRNSLRTVWHVRCTECLHLFWRISSNWQDSSQES